MVSQEKITKSLNGLIQDFMTRSGFFRSWKKEMPQEACEGFLVSFDYLVKSFPSLIAAGAALASDEKTRMVLAVNLFQESGEGDLSRTHHAIYRKFLQTAGLETASLPEESFAMEWKNRLLEYIQQSDERTALGALAAGEFLAQPALSALYPALKSQYPKADQEYFTKHLALEVEHVAEITELIQRNASSEKEFQEIVEGFNFALSAWGDFFDTLAAHLKKAEAKKA